jgi:ribose transport system substrate-binding protein
VTRNAVTYVLSFALACVAGCGQAPESVTDANDAAKQAPLKLAFITNNTAGFWQIAHAGIKKAESELGLRVTFEMPPNGAVEEQIQYLENKIARGYDAVAISPIDAENMVPVLDKVAERLPLFTHDSDAPDSDRLAYVGTNNYEAGRLLGTRLLKVLPDGGKIVMFVGNLDAQNANDRRRGILDVITESGIPIVESTECKLDGTDRARAKQNVEDVIASSAGVDVLIGLYAYNGPAIASVLKNSNNVGKIKALCFDEDAETLRAVGEGVIEATVVQQPFEFGYQVVHLMVDYLKNGESVLPDGGVLDIPVLEIDADKVDDFQARLEELTKGA